MTVVVKLGGSLATAGTLWSWVSLLAEHGRGRCAVVPGGGVFADGVRAAQRRLGFSDRAAHRMALLAMEQYALLLADLQPDWRLCTSAAEIATALADGRVAVWLPRRMIDADPDVPATWDVTSDSLAAWLAGRLRAARLILVKSAAAPQPPLSARGLAEAGLVDAAFPAYAEAARCELRYCGPGDAARLAEALGLG